MKASELRIGNYISLGAYIYDNWYEVDGDNLAEFADDGCDPYKPIPLTEEWLVKFGFDHYQAGFWRIKIHADQDRYLQVLPSLKEFWDVEILIEKRREENIELWIRSIHYVHQLQNLYFALTGEELTANAS